MVPLLIHHLLLLNPHIRKTFHSDLLLVLKNLHPHLLVILKTQKNLHPHIRKILLLVLKNQKNLHPHIRKRHQIFHPHHHTHHHLLLLLLLMKLKNLHPQTKVLKTIKPKQVHLVLIPLLLVLVRHRCY
jgi:hypothetical protein